MLLTSRIVRAARPIRLGSKPIWRGWGQSGRRARQRAHRSRVLDSGRVAWSDGKAKSILTAATTHRTETLDQTP